MQQNAFCWRLVVRKESAEASFGLQPERQLEGMLSFSRSLYSKSDWSKLFIEKSLQKAREQTTIEIG